MYEKLKVHYGELFKRYGAEDERALGWSKNKQDVRFEQLFRFLKPENGTLLDVGCGFGDMYQYLRKMQKDDIEYFGIDIMPEFVETANKLLDCSFECQDILNMDDCTYDYVVASGIFGVKIYSGEKENYAHMEKIIKKALEVCRVGIAMSFLSDKTDYHTSEDDFHAAPEKVLAIAYKYSRNVILDNSVMPFEFFLTIFKDDSFNKDTTIFNSYFGKSSGSRSILKP